MSFHLNIPIQLLRNSILGVRPNPSDLLQGQPFVNTNAQRPGLFFADSTGSELIKIGPIAISETPTSETPSLGEGWVQPDGDSPGVPMLWIYDGTNWRGTPLPDTFVEP